MTRTIIFVEEPETDTLEVLVRDSMEGLREDYQGLPGDFDQGLRVAVGLARNSDEQLELNGIVLDGQSPIDIHIISAIAAAAASIGAVIQRTTGLLRQYR